MPPAHTTSVYGSKIVYYDLGSGPALVLVHGMGASASLDWAQVIKPLAARYRVIALDQIGWGLSGKPTIDYTIDTWVDFLGEFLRGMNIPHAIFAGESLGGWIVAKYAITAAHDQQLPKVDKLILTDAAGHAGLFQARANTASASFPYSRGPSTLAAYRDGLRGIFFNPKLLDDEYTRQMYMLKLSWRDADTGASLLASLTGDPKRLAAQAVDGHLPEIRVPTLVVWGANDTLVPLADGQDFAKNISGAKLVVVPECGHVPPVEKASEYVKAVFDFLGGGR
jgi:pimeloyl-ACP methyl ester carboxylesterase